MALGIYEKSIPSLEFNLTVIGNLQVKDFLAQEIHKMVSYSYHL